MFNKQTLTITLFSLLGACFFCACKNAELIVTGPADTNAINITFEAPLLLSDQTRIPVSYENTLNINLTSDKVTLVSDQGVSCTITILNGDTVRPQIVLTNCSGSGQYYLVIAEGSAVSVEGVLSAQAQSEVYTL